MIRSILISCLLSIFLVLNASSKPLIVSRKIVDKSTEYYVIEVNGKEYTTPAKTDSRLKFDIEALNLKAGNYKCSIKSGNSGKEDKNLDCGINWVCESAKIHFDLLVKESENAFHYWITPKKGHEHFFTGGQLHVTIPKSDPDEDDDGSDECFIKTVF